MRRSCDCGDCYNNIDDMGVAEIVDNLKDRLKLGQVYVITDDEVWQISRAIRDAKQTVHASTRAQRLNDALAYLQLAIYPRDKRQFMPYVQPPPKRGLWHYAV